MEKEMLALAKFKEGDEKFSKFMEWMQSDEGMAERSKDVGPIMKKLEKLGAIKLVQTGKRGAHSSRAALYVSEA